MVSRISLERRVGRLGTPVRIHLVFIEDGETEDQAISRYQCNQGKIIGENDTVHVVRFVRLRAAGVTRETRSALLGHKTGDITTHYSAPEIRELLSADDKISQFNLLKNPPQTLLRAYGRT